MSDDLPAADLCPVLTAWADVMGGEEAITYAEDGDAMEQLEATLRAAADRIEANAQTIEKANDRAQVWMEVAMAHEDRAFNLAAALADVLPADPCSLDHNDFCQAHYYDTPCPIPAARTLLEATTDD